MTTGARVIAGATLALLCASCATQTAKAPAAGKRSAAKGIRHVRTTAYTGSEGTGHRNAIGQNLSGANVRSAASDWSRFPLGTKFRVVSTGETFVIDDYGGALIGTNTIDLFKSSRSAMRNWGVRHVDIEILEWGSDEKSLKILSPRRRNRLIRRMVTALEERARTETTLRTF